MPNEEERVPIEQVLPGMTIHPLPEGWEPLWALVLIKGRDENGEGAWSYRTSDAPNRQELLGALMVQADLLREELLDEWRPEGEDNDTA